MTSVLLVDVHSEIYGKALRAEFPAIEVTEAQSLGKLTGDLSDVDVLLAFGVGMTDDFIRRLRALKWIQSLATGVDHFLRCPSLPPHVVITSTRGIHAAPMRETVVYLMMALGRESPRLVEAKKAHHWDRQFWSLMSGKTAAVAGIGVVGTAIGQLLKAFGMRVIGLSRTPRDIEGFDEIVPTGRLREVAGKADYLINVLPGSKENLKLFDAGVFAAMKPTAYFINVGRGQTVDEEALIACLRAGGIAGAGLDVFQAEPLPPASPFWDLPNVFITPHLGGYIVEYEELVLPTIIGNMRHFLAGRPQDMRNIVNR